jgi:phosphoserine/homoserine phosphotransferase
MSYATTYFARCDGASVLGSSQCRKGLYRGSDWYHKPGENRDLCQDCLTKIVADDRKAYVNVRSEADLGGQAAQYALDTQSYFARCDVAGCRKVVHPGPAWYHVPGSYQDKCSACVAALPAGQRECFTNICSSADLGDQRPEYLFAEEGYVETSERDLIMVALDVEGTLMPEAWLALQEKTGIEGLKRTTAHEPDYNKLMKYRYDLLREHNIKLADMREVVKDLKPLPGAKEFLEWLRPIVPRILLLTDTFEEYAMPMFEQLGYPTVFCNSLVMDKDGFMVDHVLRLKDQKRKAVESFQRLNFRVIAIGDSFNDISMLKAAERGILIYPSERVIKAHPEFPVATSHDDLRKKVGRILSSNVRISPRPLAAPAPLHDTEAARSMWLLICNVAGTLAPDPWRAVYEKTKIEELSATTSDEPDYSKLMQVRAQALRQHEVKLQDVFNVMEKLDILPGAKAFLEWLKPYVPRTVLITDGFEEYANPVEDKLGHPMVFCNFLEADREGYMARLIVRLKDQKVKTVEELQRLNFKVLAVGCSFNDVGMLNTAEAGVLFRPSDTLRKAHPQIPAVSSYLELQKRILQIIGVAGEPESKRAKIG